MVLFVSWYHLSFLISTVQMYRSEYGTVGNEYTRNQYMARRWDKRTKGFKPMFCTKAYDDAIAFLESPPHPPGCGLSAPTTSPVIGGAASSLAAVVGAPVTAGGSSSNSSSSTSPCALVPLDEHRVGGAVFPSACVDTAVGPRVGGPLVVNTGGMGQRVAVPASPPLFSGASGEELRDDGTSQPSLCVDTNVDSALALGSSEADLMAVANLLEQGGKYQGMICALVACAF